MKLVVVHGSRELPPEQGNALLLDIGARMDARRLQRRLERTTKRHEGFPERQSVAIAMLAVEEHIVKALWTIQRQPLGKIAPLRIDQDGDIRLGKCGIDFLYDNDDTYARYYDAKDGKYWSPNPRPSPPKAEEITAADRIQRWLLLVPDERMRKLLVVGATNKRGDAGRQVQWERVREHLPEWDGYTLRTLRAQYQEALRVIASELALARIA